jgi:hypothetical protein
VQCRTDDCDLRCWTADFLLTRSMMSWSDREVQDAMHCPQLVVRFIRTIPKSTEAVQALGMRAGIVLNVTQADRHRLGRSSRIAARRKSTCRGPIILATAEGCGTAEIKRRSGKSKPGVWRWQARFITEGVEGLTCDETREPGKQPQTTHCRSFCGMHGRE